MVYASLGVFFRKWVPFCGICSSSENSNTRYNLFVKTVYYKKPLKTEWSREELELLGNELLRPEAIERLEIMYKSSVDVDTTLSELGSVIYNCAQKSERFNKKINVNFFDNECKVMKNYLEDLRESVKNYSLYEGKSGT